MRKTALFLAAAIFPYLCFAADEPVPAGASAELEWDHSGLDVNGNPESLATFQVAAYTPDGQTLVNAVDVPSCGAVGAAMTCAQAIAGLSLSSGIYLVKIRAVDAAGNVSAWSEPLLIVYEVSAPAAPSKPRVRVTVIVEIE